MTDDIASLRASVERLREQREKWQSRAESAEATIARLAKVVRAALAYYATMQVGAGHSTGCPLIERNETCTCGDAEDAALDASFRALTAEDRRRAGIEG